MIENRNILICPLDWGLGHATRCIPVIDALIINKNRVLIAATGRSKIFLEKQYSEVEFIDMEGYNIQYPYKGNMSWKMLSSIPKIFKGIKKENKILDNIIDKYEIDIVISDNRLGLSNPKAYCIYITHQITIKCPYVFKPFEYLLYKLHSKYINRYDECWIPDIEGDDNLSGDLGHLRKLPSNAKYIGWLSRFYDLKVASEQIVNTETEFDLLAMISGPEPQRSIFQKKIIQQASESNLIVAVVSGEPESNKVFSSGNVTVYSNPTIFELLNLLINAKKIICRPGYSTLMDLLALQKNAILVPTPGQTEQEYLAANLLLKGLFYSCKQDKLNILTAMKESEKYKGFGENKLFNNFNSFFNS